MKFRLNIYELLVFMVGKKYWYGGILFYRLVNRVQ